MDDEFCNVRYTLIGRSCSTRRTQRYALARVQMPGHYAEAGIDVCVHIAPAPTMNRDVCLVYERGMGYLSSFSHAPIHVLSVVSADRSLSSLCGGRLARTTAWVSTWSAY